MKVTIPLYNRILDVVKYLSKQLKFDKFENKLGRKLAIKINETISLAILKQRNGIATKKSLYETFLESSEVIYYDIDAHDIYK